ncbi:MAG: cbb3-type cytochrome c oxidase subunit I, partial [Verrucomicrobiota bacterium]
ASCRVPLMLMFFSAASWLALSAIFSFIASLKFHAPEKIFAQCSHMTFGHVQAAANSLLIYGFAIQAGLGAMLWLFCRTGKTTLFQPVLATLGAIFWNVGVTIGAIGIFIGDQSGFEWLEFPKYANGTLLVGYLVIALVAGLTFHDRQTKESEPSQWFLVGAMFWFPWIFSTAIMLLQVAPVRGVMQAVVNNWYGANLVNIWLAFVGLAVVFYLMPVQLKRPVHNRYLAMFAFWVLALVGGWGGMHATMPVPSWLPGVSSMMTILTIVPVLAVAFNLHRTFGRDFHLMKDDLVLSFVIVGASAYVIYGGLNAATGVQELNVVTHFTFFSLALNKLALYGFFSLTLSAAIYYIVPKITGSEWPLPGLVKLHLWCGGIGMGIYFLSLGLAGVLQGQRWYGGASFMDVANGVLRPFQMSTFGDLLILIGQVGLIANLKWLLFLRCRACCQSFLADVRGTKTAEVGA